MHQMSNTAITNDNNNFAPFIFWLINVWICRWLFWISVFFFWSYAFSEKYLDPKQSPTISHNDLQKDGAQLLLSKWHEGCNNAFISKKVAHPWCTCINSTESCLHVYTLLTSKPWYHRDIYISMLILTIFSNFKSLSDFVGTHGNKDGPFPKGWFWGELHLHICQANLGLHIVPLLHTSTAWLFNVYSPDLFWNQKWRRLLINHFIS